MHFDHLHTIIRDFHVPKYVIEGDTVELHCGVTGDDWDILDSLRWFKVSYFFILADKIY